MSATSRTDALDNLTPRERDVLHHMVQGHTDASIAERLHISQSAVEKHVNTIFNKLGLSHHRMQPPSPGDPALL